MKTILAPLKERLEQVWSDPRICCPSHVTRWGEASVGWTQYADIGLFYHKGKSRIPRKKRIGHKLNAHYGTLSRMSRRIE
jgi:hypothetical protein